MNIKPIVFEYNDNECERGAIKCPTCGHPWLEDNHGEYSFPEPLECSHLKFMLLEDDDIHWFNDFSETQLMAALEPAVRKLKPHLDGVTVKDFFEGVTVHQAMQELGFDDLEITTESQWVAIYNRTQPCHWFDKTLWQLVDHPCLDTILEHVEHGMACGPVSCTAYYGAILNSEPR